MYITKDNLTIRNASSDDACLLCRWWNDGSVMAHAGFPNGLGTTEEKICGSLLRDSDESGRRLIIEYGGMPVGEMSYRNVSNPDKTSRIAEIGIKICNSAYQNKGYGTGFLRMLIGYLFSSLGFEKIVLDTNLDNRRAQHVYEKIGFVRIGVRYNAWKNQLGVFQSAVDYELAADKWLKHGENFTQYGGTTN
jgi:RimJ/RimL family protein N-acetyltransferase